MPIMIKKFGKVEIEVLKFAGERIEEREDSWPLSYDYGVGRYEGLQFEVFVGYWDDFVDGYSKYYAYEFSDKYVIFLGFYSIQETYKCASAVYSYNEVLGIYEGRLQDLNVLGITPTVGIG